MSAIWGMVDFINETGSEELAKRMEEQYYSYKIDDFRKHVSKDAIFGYCGQHFTKEAEKEVLPIIDETENCIFVADVVLDNRNELFDILGVEEKERKNIPDGTLMHLIIKKYAQESFGMFLGTYAFAYYDQNNKKIFLVTDAVGSRCLYYYFEKGKLFFSTVLKPILEARNEKNDWNYRLLSDFLALDNLNMYSEPEETPYQGIYKVVPGQAVIINELGVKKETYWNPPINEKPEKKPDEVFKKEFITLFDKCVSVILRSSERTGMLLSGGLDSTSVACFAAPKLKEMGETLYTYTSVPEEDYKAIGTSFYVTNEKVMVEHTKQFLGNLSCNFLSLPGINCFDGTAEFMKRLELPYKSLQNIRWMHACAKKAKEDGCRIMLTGQYGNTTISFGDFEMHFYSLLSEWRFIELYKETEAYNKKYHFGRKNIYRLLLNFIIQGVFKQKRKLMFENVYLNPKLLQEFDVEHRFRLAGFDKINKRGMTLKAYRSYMAFKDAFVQIGEFETRFSLETGVLFRDPTRDKRLIEFCMRLPQNQFIYRGTDRRLVREYLDGYLPAKISKEYRYKGLQGADLIERLEKNWQQIYKECESILQDDLADKLLDVPKVLDKMRELKENLQDADMFEVLKLLYSVLLVQYIMKS